MIRKDLVCLKCTSPTKPETLADFPDSFFFKITGTGSPPVTTSHWSRAENCIQIFRLHYMLENTGRISVTMQEHRDWVRGTGTGSPPVTDIYPAPGWLQTINYSNRSSTG
jgi:hypothetical protein